MRVGTRCNVGSECASLGAGAFCKQSTVPESGYSPTSYPAGFCTLPCTGTCPSGSVCAGGVSSLPLLFNETERFCTKACTTAGECGEIPNFTCRAVGNLTATPIGGCWLASPTTFTGGGQPNKLGQGCSSTAQCANPPDVVVATCLTTLPGGYCAAYADLADTSAWCGAGGIGIRFPGSTPDGGTAEVCLQACSNPGGAASRSGYSCFGVVDRTQGAVWRSTCTTASQCTAIDAQLTQCTNGICCNASNQCQGLSPMTR